MLCQASLERLAAWLLSMPSSAGVQLRREDAANAILAAADSHAPIYPLLRLVVQLCRQITVLMMRDENIRRQFHAAQLKRADDVCGRSKPSPPPSNMVTCTCCFPSSLPPGLSRAGGQGGGGVAWTSRCHLEPSQKNSPGLTSPPQARTQTQPGSGCPCWGTDTYFYQNRKSAYQKHKTLHMENNISVYPLLRVATSETQNSCTSHFYYTPILQYINTNTTPHAQQGRRAESCA